MFYQNAIGRQAVHLQTSPPAYGSFAQKNISGCIKARGVNSNMVWFGAVGKNATGKTTDRTTGDVKRRDCKVDRRVKRPSDLKHVHLLVSHILDSVHSPPRRAVGYRMI